MAAWAFGLRKGGPFQNAGMVHFTSLSCAADVLQVPSARTPRRTATLGCLAACLLWGSPAGAMDCEPAGACGGWAVDDHWTQQGRGATRERKPVQEYGHGCLSLPFGPA